MDKLGPICRSVEDCALVFEAIYGPDGKDATVIEAPFRWNADLDIRTLRVGYVKSLFEEELAEDDDTEMRANDLGSLEALRDLGIDLIPIELPNLPVERIWASFSAPKRRPPSMS